MLIHYLHCWACKQLTTVTVITPDKWEVHSQKYKIAADGIMLRTETGNFMFSTGVRFLLDLLDIFQIMI